MKALKIKLENFDLSGKGAAAIYTPNGVMKSFLALPIKSLEGIPEAQSRVAELTLQFDKVLPRFEEKVNLTQLPVKTQVEIQIGLVFSGIPEMASFA